MTEAQRNADLAQDAYVRATESLGYAILAERHSLLLWQTACRMKGATSPEAKKARNGWQEAAQQRAECSEALQQLQADLAAQLAAVEREAGT